MQTINMTAVFNSMDKRFADARATIAKYTDQQVEEASRLAWFLHRCDKTSLRHLEDTVQQLRDLFKPLV